MIAWFLRRALNRLESQIGVPVDYLRHLSTISPRAFLKFLLLGPAAAHRQAAPRELLHAVRIVAAQHEDCGSCVQIAINVARRDGVPAALLTKVLAGDLVQLPDDVVLACQFACSVVRHDGDDERLRRQLRERYSEAVVIDLALAIALARVFPTLKRGLGFALNCYRATVESAPSPPTCSREGFGVRHDSRPESL